MGGDGYEAIVLEADVQTFTVVALGGVSPWKETHVLQHYCIALPEGQTTNNRKCAMRRNCNVDITDRCSAIARGEAQPAQDEVVSANDRARFRQKTMGEVQVAPVRASKKPSWKRLPSEAVEGTSHSNAKRRRTHSSGA